MPIRKEYLAGWINTTINDFLDEIDEPTQAMTYALISCLDSDPEVSSIFERNRGLDPFKVPNRPVGQGALLLTKDLIAANRRRRIFFGFDEVWFFPGGNVTPKPHDLVITRPHPIDLEDSSQHVAWMNANKCSLGLGDGEGMNYCLKVQGVARYIVRAFNDATTHTAG